MDYRGTGVYSYDTTLIVDGTFNNSDWSSFIHEDTGPNPGFHQAEQKTTGGNLDKYRELTHNWSAIGGDPAQFIHTVHIYWGESYNPSIAGPILGINFSFDLSLFAWDVTAGIRYTPMMVQNGVYYILPTSPPYEVLVTDSQWTHFSIPQVVESDFFVLGDPLGLGTPDFSANGSPIHFGYYAANASKQAGSHFTVSGIDNYTVSISSSPDPTLIPEPTTIVLMGFGLVGLLGVVIRQRRKEK